MENSSKSSQNFSFFIDDKNIAGFKLKKSAGHDEITELLSDTIKKLLTTMLT